jgi:hypothetical protein
VGPGEARLTPGRSNRLNGPVITTALAMARPLAAIIIIP